MPCDTRLKDNYRNSRRRQTISERAEEVRRVVSDINSLISANKVKPIIDKLTGAIAFQGLDETIRDGVTDACVYRRLMITGSSLTKAAIQRAEQIAGRTVDKQALAQGHHSHDGGATWHHGH
jgi:ATP:corrinoid adenosyltransferase